MSLIDPMSLVVKNPDDFSKMYDEDSNDLEDENESRGCCSILSNCVSSIAVIMVSVGGYNYYLEQQTSKLALNVK